MDTITHVLAGSLLSTALFVNAKSGVRDKAASYSLIIGSVFPDSDFVFTIFSDVAALKYHRGFTHSLVGVLFFSLLWAFLFSYFSSYKNRHKLFLPFAGGMLLHILMDVATPYGTMIFSPFSQVRVALDLFFIIDFTFSSIVIIPQIIAYYRKPEGKAAVARVGLILLAGYVLFVGYNHWLALERTRSIVQQQEVPVLKTATLPRPPIPLYWTSLIETPTDYRQIRFETLFSDDIRWEFHAKVENDLFIRKAEELELVKLFRWFARFPQIARKSSEDSEIVEYFDLRFAVVSGRKPFILKLVFNQKGELRETIFSHRHISSGNTTPLAPLREKGGF